MLIFLFCPSCLFSHGNFNFPTFLSRVCQSTHTSSRIKFQIKTQSDSSYKFIIRAWTSVARYRHEIGENCNWWPTTQRCCESFQTISTQCWLTPPDASQIFRQRISFFTHSKTTTLLTAPAKKGGKDDRKIRPRQNLSIRIFAWFSYRLICLRVAKSRSEESTTMWEFMAVFLYIFQAISRHGERKIKRRRERKWVFFSSAMACPNSKPPKKYVYFLCKRIMIFAHSSAAAPYNHSQAPLRRKNFFFFGFVSSQSPKPPNSLSLPPTQSSMLPKNFI